MRELIVSPWTTYRDLIPFDERIGIIASAGHGHRDNVCLFLPGWMREHLRVSAAKWLAVLKSANCRLATTQFSLQILFVRPISASAQLVSAPMHRQTLKSRRG